MIFVFVFKLRPGAPHNAIEEDSCGCTSLASYNPFWTCSNGGCANFLAFCCRGTACPACAACHSLTGCEGLQKACKVRSATWNCEAVLEQHLRTGFNCLGLRKASAIQLRVLSADISRSGKGSQDERNL